MDIMPVFQSSRAPSISICKKPNPAVFFITGFGIISRSDACLLSCFAENPWNRVRIEVLKLEVHDDARVSFPERSD